MTRPEQARRATARKVMVAAWKIQRASLARAFADCLTAAWRWIKSGAPGSRLTRSLAHGGRVALRSTVTTPTGRAAASARFVRNADWHAAGMTGRLSW